MAHKPTGSPAQAERTASSGSLGVLRRPYAAAILCQSWNLSRTHVRTSSHVASDCRVRVGGRGSRPDADAGTLRADVCVCAWGGATRDTGLNRAEAGGATPALSRPRVVHGACCIGGMPYASCCIQSCAVPNELKRWRVPAVCAVYVCGEVHRRCRRMPAWQLSEPHAAQQVRGRYGIVEAGMV